MASGATSYAAGVLITKHFQDPRLSDKIGGFYVGRYNSLNGVPCCADRTLMTDILRGEWGFNGYVVSDCWAIQDIYKYHGLAKTVEEAAALAVKAGCDLNCGEAFGALVHSETKHWSKVVKDAGIKMNP